MASTAMKLALSAAILLGLGVVLTGLLQDEEDPLVPGRLEAPAALPVETEATAPAPRGTVEPPMQATTPAEVRQVLRYCRAARATDKDALRRMALQSEDPLVVAGNAIRALGRLRELPGDEKLTALLHDPRLRVRQDTVQALGQSASPRAVELLAPLLDVRDPQVRPLVIQALGRLGDWAAKQLIESVLADAEATDTERVFARAALRRCR